MDLKQFAELEGLNALGFQALLADHGLIVSKEAARLWLKGERKIGAKSVPAVVAATGGKVTREHLRPDIYGPPNQQVAA